MRAIRRFTVRPVLPRSLAAAGRPGRQPALVLAPARRRTSSPRSTPRCGRRSAHDPVRLLGAVAPRAAGRARRGRRLPAAARRREADLDGVPHRRPLVPAQGRRRRAPRRSATSPRSSASPRCCRSTPAASASWPATTSRPPATSACRSSASGCSTSTATSSSRCPARAGSRRPTRSSTPTSCRSRCCARPTATRATVADRAARRPGRCSPGSGSAQVGRVPLLLLDSDVEDNPDHYREVTDRLYGGTNEHRLRQELLLGVGGVRALRVYSPDHRRTRRPRCSTPTRATPASSASSGSASSPSARAARASTGTPRSRSPARRTVFTTHTPVPAGIDRFPRELVEQYFGGATARPPACPVEQILALGTEDYEGGDPRVFNMAVMGFRLVAARQRRLAAARPRQPRACSTACGRPSTRPRCRSARSPTACTRPTWVAREIVRAGRAVPRRRPRRRRHRRVLRRRRQGARHRDLGGQARAARAPGRRRPPAAAPSRGASAASPRPSSAGSTRRSTPTC